jgi:hypothetical protein
LFYENHNIGPLSSHDAGGSQPNLSQYFTDGGDATGHSNLTQSSSFFDQVLILQKGLSKPTLNGSRKSSLLAGNVFYWID